MAAATAGGSLTIEVDEDMLVENAASAPTLFSPGMWVQRPTRTPATAAAEGRPRMISACGSPGAQLLPMPMSAFPQAPPYAPATSSRPSTAGTAAGTSLGAAPQAGTPGSPGLEADPDLAYLNVADDRERERAEREYLQQDSEHMAALEDAYARLRDQNSAMEQQLQGVVSSVSDVMDENRTIKQLLGMLKVRREDFVFNQHQTICAQQEAIGMRLLQNVEEDSPPSAQQPQHAQPPATRQQRQQAGAAAVPLHLQQQQLQQQQQQQQQCSQEQQQMQQGPALELGMPPPLFHASPGSMLPLDTPSMLLRTVSPKIAAFRGSGATDMLMDDANELVAPNTVPATPQEFPAEAQIAAAALTAKQGDTAAALLTLLDKAIEGRMERQQHAAEQAAEQALLKESQQQQQQQEAQQQQQAMY